jgi:ribonucleotide reductase alpha subunit
LGYNECIEPITSNIYRRSTLAGEFMMINKYLAQELIDADLWNDRVIDNIIANRGSVQQLHVLPDAVRKRFLTVWELPNKDLIDMAVSRGAFICQSQSLNLWDETPNYSRMTAMHLYSWKNGLKTGVYYFRRRPSHQPQQFTIVPQSNLSLEMVSDDEDDEDEDQNKQQDQNEKDQNKQQDQNKEKEKEKEEEQTTDEICEMCSA